MKKEVQLPKYTIVIPTRNREEYLPYAIESVLSSDRDDIELIVSNNHSLDGTAAYLSTLTDARVKVVMPSAELPMSSHYEFALSQATGEWVTILGDDDAVMPYLFERLDRLTTKYPGVSIISSERAYYFWEGCEDLYGESVVAYWGGGGARLRSTKKDLILALAGLRSCFDLPQIYTTCVVKTSLINRVKGFCGGKFFHSIIPDMYSAVALSLAEKTYLRVEEPLFWTGTSNKSMGRSDRIYKDSELSTQRSNENAKSDTLKLHDEIPKKLHILGFGSLYLYEALLHCPLPQGFWKSPRIKAIVYASLLVNAQAVSIARGVDKDGLVSDIHAEIRRTNVSFLYLKSIIVLITTLSAIQKIFSLPRIFLRKVRRWIKKDVVVSTSREGFNTILDASRAVEDVLRKC